jgi:RHS repeat-associated protein
MSQLQKFLLLGKSKSTTLKGLGYNPYGSPQNFTTGSKAHQGTAINWAHTTHFSIDPRPPIYPGDLFQGVNRVDYWARANNGAENTRQSIYFTIDNTPQLSISQIDQVEGAYDVTGMAGFIQASPNQNWGTLTGSIKTSGGSTKASFSQKPFNYSSAPWSFTSLYGYQLDSTNYTVGTYTATITAVAKNGTQLIKVENFEVPEIKAIFNFGDCPKTCPSSCPMTDNPINVATGNKFVKQKDFSSSDLGLPFDLVRSYNSQSTTLLSSGYGWSHNFSDTISVQPTPYAYMWRQGDGRTIRFENTAPDVYTSETDKAITLVRTLQSGAYVFDITLPDGTKRHFDRYYKLTEIRDRFDNVQSLTYSGNNLSYVLDNFGRRIDFEYNAAGRLTAAVTPAGRFEYTYDANNNLTQVKNPDQTTKNYSYTGTDVHNLTGFTDENGITALTVAYDSKDRAISSELAGGAEKVTVTYNPYFERVVTDNNGNAKNYKIRFVKGVGKVERASSVCGSCGTDNVEYLFNARAQITQKTDGNGNITQYTFDARGNRLTETQAVGSAIERTTTYTYHPTYDLVATVTKDSVGSPGSQFVTTFTYDVQGRLQSKAESGYSNGSAVSRTWSYQNNTYGQMTQVDGPRTDVSDITTFEYYLNDPAQGLNRGLLKRVTNALSQYKEYRNYNARGQHQELQDENGVVTAIAYDSMGRLNTKTTAGLVTDLDYDNAGRLTATHFPGGKNLFYTYTGAGKLETITDNAGNKIKFYYNAIGKKSREEYIDPAQTVRKYTDFEYDSNGRLHKIIYPGGANEERNYDDTGNLIEKIDPNGNAVSFAYDELNRLVETTQPGSIVTSYGYDDHSNLVSVTDAEGQTTTYVFDDFGLKRQEASPDTGATLLAYNPAGVLTQKTDARAITTNFTYDAVNRLTAVLPPSATENIVYAYDAGSNGVGRLTGITDPTGVYTLSYDALGRLTSEQKIILGTLYTTQYGYASAGQLNQIVYPSGRVVTMGLDSDERVTAITSLKSGITRNVATGISYLPFGPVAGWTYGSGLQLTQTFDQLYRIASIVAGNIYSVSYAKDSAGNITQIQNVLDGTRTQNFGYDELNRLESATGIYGSIAWTYDGVGNRLSQIENGISDTYLYTQGTNRLASVTGGNPNTFVYDAAGNTTGHGLLTLDYNYNSRMVMISDLNGPMVTYKYNSNNQRVIKDEDGQITVYHYDQVGNLIGESTAGGVFLADYIYHGIRPVAKFDTTQTPEPSFYVVDHLGTPQKMVNPANVVVWNGDIKPFGQAVLQTNLVPNNIRFPGQYEDTESGFHYNWHRYYDQETGKYLRPDPIGLNGGINRYLYALANPAAYLDVNGLEIRIYMSPAFGEPWMNHAFIHSSKTGKYRGTNGSSGIGSGNQQGGGSTAGPFVILMDIGGLSEEEAMNRIMKYPLWDTGLYMPFINDCHAQLERALRFAEIPNPGFPRNRINWHEFFEAFDTYLSIVDNAREEAYGPLY